MNHYQRRDFIKTSALGLSSIFAMSKAFGAGVKGASAAAGGGQPRFIFLRKSSGISPEWLVPPSLKDKPTAMDVSLDNHDLVPWMEPLQKHKQNLTLLQGLSARMCTMGHATYQSPMAVCKAQGGRLDSIPRASVDVVLGRMFPTPLRSSGIHREWSEGYHRWFVILWPGADELCLCLTQSRLRHDFQFSQQ